MGGTHFWTDLGLPFRSHFGSRLRFAFCHFPNLVSGCPVLVRRRAPTPPLPAFDYRQTPYLETRRRRSHCSPLGLRDLSPGTRVPGPRIRNPEPGPTVGLPPPPGIPHGQSGGRPMDRSPLLQLTLRRWTLDDLTIFWRSQTMRCLCEVWLLSALR